ncbi:conserved hypothetical protein [Marinobacter salarius]|nr:conserved hypothetical protein [Marinobacter salarius]
MVEQLTCNQQVGGSIPSASSTLSLGRFAVGMPDSEGFPSGQRDQTVNLTRKLRRFESCPLHHLLLAGIV